MSNASELSPSSRLAVGLLFVTAGVLSILAALDVGPWRQRDINGPPWLAAVAGVIIVLAGLSIFAGERARNHPLSSVMVFLVLAGFAAIGNWIAFGPGPRACSVEFTGFFVTAPWAAGLECRIAFGIGAVMLDGFLVFMLANGLRTLSGPGRLPDALDRLGWGVLLLTLAPILIPMLLALLGKSLFGSMREYAKTGRWPRNEAFIARMRARMKEKRRRHLVG